MGLRELVLVWLLIVVVSPAHGETNGVEANSIPSGELRDRLTLKDSQSGFAGVTSDVWTIEPDGNFTIERLLDGKPVAPARNGVLTPENLEGIAEVLATHGLDGSSAEAGAVDKVNARSLTLTFGDQTTFLSLPSGESLAGLTCSAKASSGLEGPEAVAAAIVGAAGTLDWDPAAPQWCE